MSFISRQARRIRNEYSMADFDREVKEKIRGRVSSAGVRVSEESAMRHITVYSCARVLAETLAATPLFVYQDTRSGKKRKAWDHPLYEVLYGIPNNEMCSMTWRETKMGHITLSGNCYSIITTNGRGQVIDLYPIPWTQMEPRRNEKTRKIEYVLTDRGKQELYPFEKIFHIPGLGFDGVKGYSPVRMAQEAIGVGLATDEFAGRFFSQGMNIGTVIQYDNPFDPESRAELKKDLMERGAGLANSWMPLIVDDGGKIERIPMPLQEAQFVEIQKLTREQICGLFRVPPHMVANLERATLRNIEHQDLGFVKHTMLPWYIRWEQGIFMRLISRQDRSNGYYAKFNVEGLLRGDYKSRQEGLAIQRQNGVLKTDEWRELEERDPIGGDVGEALLVNGNMISVETAMKQQPRNTGTQQTIDSFGGVVNG